MPEIDTDNKIVMKLYVSGMSPNSIKAIKNIRSICDEYLQDNFELEIIDIYKNPEMAASQHIVFCPSLIKHLPLPKKVLIGTLAEKEKVIAALGISL